MIQLFMPIDYILFASDATLLLQDMLNKMKMKKKEKQIESTETGKKSEY